MMEITILIWAFICWIVVAVALGYSVGYFCRWCVQKKIEGETRLVRVGDRAFVRQFWTDERGNMIKSRYYTIHNILPSHGVDGEIPREHFMGLVGDEEEDAPSRKEMGLK